MADSLNKIMTKVAFTPKVPLVLKATSDDPNLPPGHLLNEIVNITYESLDHCENLMLFLVERLNKTSVHTKYKVLHLMKLVLEKGHEEFANGLRKNADGIEKAKTFNQAEDPLHGKAFIHKVRENAQIVSEILFDVKRTKNPPHTNSNRINSSSAGFGSSSSHNSTQATPVTTASQSGLWSDAQSILKGWKDSLVNSGQSPQPVTPENNYQRHHEVAKPTAAIPPSSFSAFGNDQSMNTKMETQGTYSGTTQLDHVDPYQISASSMYSSSLPVEQTIEYRSIGDLTSAGGVKMEPSKQDVDNFIASCQTLDQQRLAEALDRNLESNNTTVQVRTLAVIRSLLESSSVKARNEISKACMGNLNLLVSSNSSIVRERAQKIVSMLVSMTMTPPPSQLPSVNSTPIIPNSALASGVSPSETDAKISNVSLLGDFGEMDSNQRHPMPTALNTQPAPVVNAISSQPMGLPDSLDMFSGLQIHTTLNAITPSTTAPSHPPTAQTSLLDVDDMFATKSIGQSTDSSSALQSKSSGTVDLLSSDFLSPVQSAGSSVAGGIYSTGSCSDQKPANINSLQSLSLSQHVPSMSSPMMPSNIAQHDKSLNFDPFSASGFASPSITSNRPPQAAINTSNYTPSRQQNVPVNAMQPQHQYIPNQMPNMARMSSPNSTPGMTSLSSLNQVRGASYPQAMQTQPYMPAQSRQTQHGMVYSPNINTGMMPSPNRGQIPRAAGQATNNQDFNFINRTGKGDAFDFVKDAMKASKTK